MRSLHIRAAPELIHRQFADGACRSRLQNLSAGRRAPGAHVTPGLFPEDWSVFSCTFSDITYFLDIPYALPIYILSLEKTLSPQRGGVHKRMPGIKVRDTEPFEGALKRFKKQVEKAGVLSEVRKREFYEKPSVKKKRKAIAARKRALKRMHKMRSYY